MGDLLDESRSVSFDLDGSGRGQKWSWVKSDTAILVWDPERSGEITSGRQLFGNVTWWIFWENGYQALAALDDDRDGWLRGDEMKGLALWFDRNQNGRSDPGEVVPIEQTEIESIAVRFEGREADGSWRAVRGVEMKDGSVVPSWDWLARSVGGCACEAAGRSITVAARFGVDAGIRSVFSPPLADEAGDAVGGSGG